MKTVTILAVLAVVLLAACAKAPAEPVVDGGDTLVEDSTSPDVAADLVDVQQEVDELENIDELDLGDLDTLGADLDQI